MLPAVGNVKLESFPSSMIPYLRLGTTNPLQTLAVCLGLFPSGTSELVKAEMFSPPRFTILAFDWIIKTKPADDGWRLVSAAARLALFTRGAQLQNIWLLISQRVGRRGLRLCSPCVCVRAPSSNVHISLM